MRALATAVLPLLLCGGCGKIYVDPVEIEAKAEPPAVMFLLDKSGSMAAPLSPGTCACMFPNCNEAVCPTRMGTLRAWATRMLDELGPAARWGLTIFPADNVCTPAGSNQVLVTIPDAAGAGNVAGSIQAQALGGGTPTAASLTFAGQTFPTGDAERIILLVTDGQPNCSSQNPNTCLQPTECRCTLSGGNCGNMVDDSNPGNFCRRGCLDAVEPVNAARSWSTFGVFTLVAGFGSDFASDTGVLDAMAQAGLEGQQCVKDSDCFGFTCGTAGTCTGAALIAVDAAGLDAVTATMKKKLAVSGRCRWTLAVDLPNGPTDIHLGAVKVPASDYRAETLRRVRFFGDTCATLVGDPAIVPTFQGQP